MTATKSDCNHLLFTNDNKNPSFSDADYRKMFWHSSAHVLCQATLELFPKALPIVGPATSEGFFYDFANLHITKEDLKKIEDLCHEIASNNLPIVQYAYSSKIDAIEDFKNNPYKVKIINNLPESAQITGYSQGTFKDLCRGPHIKSTGAIQYFKVDKTSAVNTDNGPAITRIQGISFPSQKTLDHYINIQEEIRKRDHKYLGPKMGIFLLREEARGCPFILPKGMFMWQTLIDYIKMINDKYFYSEIKTPPLLSQELWELSGHMQFYKENMFLIDDPIRKIGLKAMNCPGAMLLYSSFQYSYKDLPLRLSETGNVFRNEPSGALSGLCRVCSFHQDDAHIFLEKEQIESEISYILQMIDEIYSTFGLSYTVELSTKPSAALGEDETWEETTAMLKSALQKKKVPFAINEGDGAFYGPKIDIHITDALGRSWQCGTIQLDFNIAERFSLKYMTSDGGFKQPIIIHRALLGSLERFLAILIEHFGIKLPLWINPNQIMVIPVAEMHTTFADSIVKEIEKDGFVVSTLAPDMSIPKRIREAQTKGYNYILVVGDKEIDTNNLAIKIRDLDDKIKIMTKEDFIDMIRKERKNKNRTSIFSQ